MENKTLKDPQEIQNLDMTDASLEGKTIELDKAPKKQEKSI